VKAEILKWMQIYKLTKKREEHTFMQRFSAEEAANKKQNNFTAEARRTQRKTRRAEK